MSRYEAVRQALMLSLVLALTGCGLMAPAGDPGFAELDSPGWRDTRATFNISLGPALLGFAAQRVDDDPEVSALLGQLEGVRVRLYEVCGDSGRIAARLEAMSARLQQQAWQPVVEVRERSEETVHMLMKIDGEDINGLVVLSADTEDVVLVNVMGNLRPELFQRAMAGLALGGNGALAGAGD